jgi:TonB family protein
MKPEERNSWRGEDYDFQREFQDVSDIFKDIDVKTPAPDLDRRIKDMAYSQVAGDLEGHWLFGGIPQLAMAVSLLFAIGVLFVISVDKQGEGEKQLSINPEIDSGSVLTAPSSVAVDDYSLIEKADPVYPTKALRRKLTGWVLMEFTISRDGRVQDPVVIDTCASPFEELCNGHADPIFDAAALQALQQFRYKPRISRGQAVAVEGVRYVVSFRLPSDSPAED